MRILKRKILGNFDKGGENFKNLCLQKKCNFAFSSSGNTHLFGLFNEVISMY